MSVHRACECVGLCRSGYYRQPMHWTIRDAELIAALAKLVEGRPNRGFWMCRKHLRRQGRPWNHKRIYRVYKLMRLNLRRAARRRLPKRERVALYVPRHPDTVWSADFMSDALSCGRRFRLFNVVDDFNREALHIEVDTSITSQRLIRIFERLRAERGLPQVLRTDNGPEFLGEAFVQWAKSAGMAIQYIQPGKPNQNAFVERFNRTRTSSSHLDLAPVLQGPDGRPHPGTAYLSPCFPPRLSPSRPASEHGPRETPPWAGCPA